MTREEFLRQERKRAKVRSTESQTKPSERVNSSTNTYYALLPKNLREKTSKDDKKKKRLIRTVEEINQLRKQLTRGKTSSPRCKAKNGISIKKTAQPIVKAVRPSLRTHQNFEAATRYKSRIGKIAIKAKHMKYISALIGNSICLLYTSPSPRDRQKSRMPSSA